MNKFTNKIISCFAALALALPLAAGCQKSERAENVEDQAEATAEKVVEGADYQADQMRKQADQVEAAGEAKADQIEAAGEAKAERIEATGDAKADALKAREDYVKASIVRLDEANRDLASLDAELAKESDAKEKAEASSAIAAAKTLRSQAQTAVDNAGTTSTATFSQVKDSTETVLDELEAAIKRADDILD